MITALLIFAGTYLVLSIGRMPGFRVDRTGAAIIGAGLMIAFGVLTMDEAIRSVNFETLILLFGMMIVVANLRLSGFFGLVSSWVVGHTHHPLALLAAILLVSGTLSAFFVNDTMCLVLTPLVLDIAARLRRNPVPYLLAVAMAANIGSAATITGNPQNMLIGTFSRIPYRDFAAAIAPAAAVGLLLAFVLVAAVYRREFFGVPRIDIGRPRVHVHRALLWKSMTAAGAMIALFFAGMPVPSVAFVAGAFLLVTRRVKPERVYKEIDWSLLVLFAGLFVVIAGVEKTLLTGDMTALVGRLRLDNTGVLTFWSALLSNLVSNVPAVLVFKPFVSQLPHPDHAWLTLAMSSTLAGNLTVLGSIANLIVIERSRRTVAITFLEYLKVGVPLTVLSLLSGAFLLGPG
jgi:Na+/H+ antiporter NhaD/arsenite permease-like protein